MSLSMKWRSGFSMPRLGGGGGGERERETRREREREVDGGSDRRMVGEREMRIKVTCNINVLLQVVKEFT